ncbi:ATP-binding protein [Microbulbifer sp. M83]
MPVFEAVVNSIHAIEEKGNLAERGQITVRVERDGQKKLDLDQKGPEPITAFTIIDNGCGFDNVNFQSFETLDSDHKVAKGCRGVGRLLWLKAFDLVEINSTFCESGSKSANRYFRFDENKGVYSARLDSSGEKATGTTVRLIGFGKNYQRAVPKTALSIANQLLEHCLWYFVRPEGAPEIVVQDGDELIRLYQLYDSYMHETARSELVKIQGEDFEVTHIKYRASATKKHQIAFCADGRMVKEENIHGKIPGLYARLKDDAGEFVYACYVSSSYLDQRVRSERTAFDLAEDLGELFDESELSLKAIRKKILECAQNFLHDVLQRNISAGENRIDSFISSKAPRFRPIKRYVPREKLVVDPEISDKDLELHLHEHWYELERELVREGHEVMSPKAYDYTNDYQPRLQAYLQKAEDIKKSDLANYVSHRKVIIDLLQKSIERGTDGKYAREEMIHELIMPMRTSSDEILLDSCNLWLVDERMAFHHYLASDKTIKSMPITESDSTKEPDILGVRVFDNPILVNDQDSFPLASITIVEIKRPMRNDMKEGEDKDPIDQTLSYLERVREGKVTTKSGRPIPGSKDVPGYCYVLCDLTESMRRRCRRANLRITYDGMGYFGYNEPSHAYIEVISFDQLVNASRERNKAFFDRLGLPTN